MVEHKNLYRSIIGVVFLGVILVPLLYWVLFRQVPMISVAEAKSLLVTSPQETLLVDVRSSQAYQALHIQSAINLPFRYLLDYLMEPTFTVLREKKHVLVICNTGISSSKAVKMMQKFGLTGVRNIDGGMEAWRTNEAIPGQACCLVKNKQPLNENLPTVDYTFIEQLAIVVTGFGVKILYLLLSFVLILCLWKQTALEIVAVRRAMTAFFIGEMACAVNYLFFNLRSQLWEYFHSYGMMVCFGLFLYALMKIMDLWFIKFTPPKEKCVLLFLCKKCYKYVDVSCTLWQVFMFVIPAAMVMAFMLFSASLGSAFYVGNIFGTSVIFGHSMVQQVFEVRFCPVLALVFFIISLVVLVLHKEGGIEVSKVIFAMGLGPLMFGLMRFLIYWGYFDNPLWGDVWEEMTELLFIGFVFFVFLKLRSLKKR